MQKRQPALGFIFITLFLDILGIGLIAPIGPSLIKSFLSGDAASVSAQAAQYVGWFSALYAIMQFLFSSVLGSLSDKYGRRAVILISLAGSALDYLLLAFAPSLWWLFVGRIIAGLTSANIATVSAYIADVSPPEKRAQNFGLIGAAFGVGFIFGPAIGGLLGSINVRLPFYVVAGITAINFLYGLFVLPESLSLENRRAFSWVRANPVGSLLALAKYPVVLSLTATIVLSGLAQNGLQTIWALYTEHRYAWTPKDVGWSLGALGLSVAIVQGGLLRVILPKLGEKRAVIFGFAISAIANVLYGLAPEGWMLYVILFVAGIGAIGGPAAQGLISRSVSAKEQGAVQGTLTSLQGLTAIFGPLIATNLFGYFISPQAPIQLPGASFFAGAIFTFIGLLLAVRAFTSVDFAQNQREANAAALADQPPVGH